MAKDHLFVTDPDRHGTCRIQWYIADLDDHGGIVGESPMDEVDRDEDRIGWECWKAHEVAASSTGVQKDFSGFYWESAAAARAALRRIKLEFKAERPIPQWARTAIENGWKQPRGWKP